MDWMSSVLIRHKDGSVEPFKLSEFQEKLLEERSRWFRPPEDTPEFRWRRYDLGVDRAKEPSDEGIVADLHYGAYDEESED